jgi:hypothetical protein
LSADEIEYLGRKIVKTLVSTGKIEVDAEAPVVDAVIRVLTEDMMAEERLNEEARQVLVEHSGEMQRSNITYTEMFNKVKRELAKKKGMVL